MSISYITVVNRHCTLNQVSQILALLSTEVSRKSVTYKEVQSFFFKFWRKNKRIFTCLLCGIC